MELSEEDFVEGLATPFEEKDIDCTKQTGADWYRTALSASMKGKSIHGLNPTPSCEMITKIPEEFARKYATGRIKFDSTEKRIPALGPHVTERPYRHKDFKGIRSAAGTFFSFDQAMWEPSLRKRAREASLLAATIAAHTNNKEAAKYIVAKITSDEIDDEAVDVATIPISHMKRDMTTVSKASSRVFSCGTIQRAITWDDTQLTNEKMPESAALDWGRITAIARYIGEANSQVDPKFRWYAENIGVPYALVRGCYAFVAYGDYVFDAAKFEDVPTIDLAKYSIPTLKDAYAHSADNIMRQCYVNLNKIAYSEPSAAATKLLEIINACKAKIRGRVHKKPKWQETDVLAGPKAHAFTAEAAAKQAQASVTAFDTLKEVLAEKINGNADLIRLAKQLVGYDKLRQHSNQYKDQLTRRVITQDVWLTTRVRLADRLGSMLEADRRVAILKRTTFKFSGRLEDIYTINASMAAAARFTITSAAKHAVLAPALKVDKRKILTSMRATQGALAIQSAAINIEHHMTYFRTGWAERYHDWAEVFRVVPGHEREVEFYEMASRAFELATYSTAIAIEARFIDGTQPKKSYLYEAAVRLARAQGVTKPRLRFTVYPNATILAQELNDNSNINFNFVQAEAFVYDKLTMFAGDFDVHEGQNSAVPGTGGVRLDDPETYEYMEIGAIRVALPTSDVADLNEFAAMFADQTAPVVETSYQAVLSTYSTIGAADAHARYNGFTSFADAYSKLKGGARYDPESAYTTAATDAIQKDTKESDDGMVIFT